ncbi:MAG TPA: hypothetical protein VHW65_00045 [Gemmatimonadales bacterium]|nr:hypothetical protein [Gemmatimonadales bacterium]
MLVAIAARAATAQDPVQGRRPPIAATPTSAKAPPEGLTAAPGDDSVLHMGAHVRVRSATITGADTVPGVVVRPSTPAGCLAVLLDAPDAAGVHHLVYPELASALLVDWRTNLGVYSQGISAPQASDWHEVTAAERARSNPSCHHGRP